MASQATITIKGSSSAASISAPRPKKRPGAPAVTAAVVSGTQQLQLPQPQQQNNSSSSSNKKKKPTPITTSVPQVVAAVETVVTDGFLDASSALPESTAKPPPFKDPAFTHSGIGGAAAGKKNRTWKNLKQILALEKTLAWKLADPNYYNIEAPPSLKPAKKYSDISGLPANYTDPQTKLRFTSSEEFSYIRLLPSDVVTGYLTLRKATCIVP